MTLQKPSPLAPVTPEAPSSKASSLEEGSGSHAAPQVLKGDYWDGENYVYIPSTVTDFDTLEQHVEITDVTKDLQVLTGKYTCLVNNIQSPFNDLQPAARMASLRKTTEQFMARAAQLIQGEMGEMTGEMEDKGSPTPEEDVTQKSTLEEFKGFLSQKFSELKTLFNRYTPSDAIFFQKGDDGLYHWFAIYSNNARDDDSPAEIISSASHQRFEKMVKEGIYPYPELWHFHVPGTTWGKAYYVAYDQTEDKGFAMAGGYVLPGFETDAENLAKAGNSIALSHGMPGDSIKRDPDDPSIIIEHQTIEISDLPRPHAANKATSFMVHTKGIPMPLSTPIRNYLSSTVGYDAKRIEEIESNLHANQKFIDGRERKDALVTPESLMKNQTTPQTPPDPETPVAASPETPVASPVSSPATTAAPETKTFVTEEALVEILTPILKGMEAMTAQLAAMTTEVKSLRENPPEPVSPAQSILKKLSEAGARLPSAIGNEATKVDGRSTLAKDAPQQASHSTQGQIGIPVLDRIISQQIANTGGRSPLQ